MFEYCLVVYMTMEDPEYKGHFIDCATANAYVAEYYSDAPYTICLHENYIFLPDHIIKKEVNYER